MQLVTLAPLALLVIQGQQEPLETLDLDKYLSTTSFMTMNPYGQTSVSMTLDIRLAYIAGNSVIVAKV